MASDTHDQGQPVNAFSNVVDPRRHFPTHFDALMLKLYKEGHQPESWRVLDAAEVHLDEDGQEVEFVLVQLVTNQVWRCSVLVCHGAAVRISSI